MFVTFFSRTIRDTRLKPGTHKNSRLMYCVYQNQGQEPITLGVDFLDRFYSLAYMKKFRYRFLRSYESSKVETW